MTDGLPLYERPVQKKNVHMGETLWTNLHSVTGAPVLTA